MNTIHWSSCLQQVFIFVYIQIRIVLPRQKFALCQTQDTSFATRERDSCEIYMLNFWVLQLKMILSAVNSIANYCWSKFSNQIKAESESSALYESANVQINWIELCILVPKSNVQRRKLAWQSSQCTGWLAGWQPNVNGQCIKKIDTHSSNSKYNYVK